MIFTRQVGKPSSFISSVIISHCMVRFLGMWWGSPLLLPLEGSTDKLFGATRPFLDWMFETEPSSRVVVLDETDQ